MRTCLLACLLLAACNTDSGSARATPLTDSLLSVAREWGPTVTEHGVVRAELDHIAREVRRAAERKPAALPSSVLNETLFGTLGFVREVDDTDLRFVLLPSVLKHRRGSCVGLGSLYLALAERLGWAMHGVMVPGHFFVRIRERGTTHNIELLRRGELMPDAWYRTRFPIPGGAAPGYARPLTATEVLGVIEYDVGNERRRTGHLSDARRAFDRSRQHFPDFAEAHASFGAVAHLLGALDEARAGYETARRIYPHLPGVTQNLALLDSERAAHP